VSAGYSGTPLVRKLGIKPGFRVAWPAAPEDFEALLDRLPDGVDVRRALRGRLDLVVCFVTVRGELERRLPALRRAIEPDGTLWVAWPVRRP
jgi:hypothetical protein